MFTMINHINIIYIARGTRIPTCLYSYLGTFVQVDRAANRHEVDISVNMAQIKE